MKELLKQVKQYKKDSVLAPVYSALEVVMEVIIPFVMALLIDEGVEKGNMNKILLYGIIMIVLAMISLFAGMMAGKYAASASSGFACNLREAMYRNIQRFSFSNIDKFSTAGLVTRMTTDVTNVQSASYADKQYGYVLCGKCGYELYIPRRYSFPCGSSCDNYAQGNEDFQCGIHKI